MDCLEIHVELTNKCILNCKHCSSLANKCTNELEFDDILNFIEKLGDEYNIRLILTGGEPLLKQNLIIPHLQSQLYLGVLLYFYFLF